MGKILSIRQMAMMVTERVIERLKDTILASDKSYAKDMLRLRFARWIEQVTNIPMTHIDAAIADGSKLIEITIDDVTLEHLPADLRIVKEFHNSASASALTDMHDRKRTRVAFDKLFTPSLFPELKYEHAREQELVLGENGRVKIKHATQDHYRLHDRIQEKNYEDQTSDIKKYRSSKRSRDRLFRMHPDCTTTDDLMRKLGVWKRRT